jgi:uncharacterized protein (TIGR02118 family)
MARMVVIHNTPKDRAGFDEHYFAVHVPLPKQLQGLRKYELSQGCIVRPAGGPEVYLVATLHCDDLAAIREAFASAVGRASADDRAYFGSLRRGPADVPLRPQPGVAVL